MLKSVIFAISLGRDQETSIPLTLYLVTQPGSIFNIPTSSSLHFIADLSSSPEGCGAVPLPRI